MKVAFIAIKGIDVIGGIETYTIELGKRLAASGHEIIVYCMQTQLHKTPFIHKGMLFYPLPTIRHKYFEKLTLTLLASIHQLKIKNLDIVHYQAVGPSVFSFIPRLFGRYTVFQSHGHEWERTSWNTIAKIFFKISESLTFTFVNDSSAVSKNLKIYYEKKYGKAVTYIPSGITPRKPLEASKILKHGVEAGNYFLYVGRLSCEKSIEDLILAYNGIENCELKLVIVGKERKEDEDYLKYLKKLADSNANIVFPGPAYNDELVEWYSNAAAYILPSVIEGLPITLLEAMSFARCCIASDIPANKEAMNGHGFLYPVGNQKILKYRMEKIIENPELASAEGKNLLRHVYKNYTWQDISNRFEKFYDHKFCNKETSKASS